MKYLRRFNESLMDKEEIHSICKEYNIKNYTINDDGSVDVDGHVDLNGKGLTKLPLKFGKVTGHFECVDNQLTSLDGSPTFVGGNFYCYNNQLTSLEGSPNRVGDVFNCNGNKLTSLIGSPKIVRGNFYCSRNNIISLMGCPENFRNLYCNGIDRKNNTNPVSVIWDLFNPNKRFIEKINHIYTDLHLGDGWTIQGDILEQIAEELEIELPTD